MLLRAIPGGLERGRGRDDPCRAVGPGQGSGSPASVGVAGVLLGKKTAPALCLM